MDKSSYLCTHYLPLADRTMTVCRSIADKYRDLCGINPAVITNACDYTPQEPSKTNPEAIRMIYHGAALPSRKIEHMITLMNHADSRFHLDMILVPGDEDYLSKIAEQITTHPRIQLRPKVPLSEIPKFLNRYDIGIFLLEPVSFNYQYALPNKLFEFIQGRLAVAIGPSPEMAKVVRQYDLGVVSNDFSPQALAQEINSIDSTTLNRFKVNAHKAAPLLSSQNNESHFLRIISDLLQEGVSQPKPETCSSNYQS